jgi:hypothetical protein
MFSLEREASLGKLPSAIADTRNPTALGSGLLTLVVWWHRKTSVKYDRVL